MNTEKTSTRVSVKTTMLETGDVQELDYDSAEAFVDSLLLCLQNNTDATGRIFFIQPPICYGKRTTINVFEGEEKTRYMVVEAERYLLN